MKKFNLIEMLQGCSKRNGTTFRHSNPDGEPTVNRQSRLMSYRGNLKNLAMLFAVLMLSIANIGMAWGAASTSTDNKYISGTVTFGSVGTLSDKTCYWYNGVKFYENNGSSSSVDAGTQAWSTSVSFPSYNSDIVTGTSKNNKWGNKDGGTPAWSMSGLVLQRHCLAVHVNSAGVITLVINNNTQDDTNTIPNLSAKIDNVAYATAYTTSNYLKGTGDALSISSSRADATNKKCRYTVTYTVSNSDLTDGEAVIKFFYGSSGTGAGKIFCYESVSFTPSGYTVTYNGSDADSGTAPTDGSSPYSSGSTVTVLGNTGSLARAINGDDATFEGWNTNSNMYGGTHYNAGETFSISGNTTLYAVWGYSITWNENGGEWVDYTAPSYYIYGQGLASLPSSAEISKSGYELDHWELDYDKSTVTSIDDEATGSVQLNAIWTPTCSELAAPTGLECVDQSYNTLSFSWDAVANASSYDVKLWTNSSCTGDPAKSANTTNTTCRIRDLSSSTTYYCKVQTKGDGSTYCTSGETTATAASGTTLSSTRTFKSGETIFFKDAGGTNISGINCLWVVDGGNVYAYFYDATTNNWASGPGEVVRESHHYGNAIYKFTVPQTTSGEDIEWEGVIFTRGTAATWDTSKGYYGQQTHNQTPNQNENLFTISTNAPTDGKYNGLWSTYANGAAVVGDMNNWRPDGGEFVYSGSTGTVYMDLEANTEYKFKVLDGTGWKGCAGTITNTTTSWWGFSSGGEDCTVRTGEEGNYAFKWDNSGDTKYLGIYYPQARLKKGEYIYFDARDNSTWTASDFDARFWFKYYDSDSNYPDDVTYHDCAKSNAKDSWVYPYVVPNSDYIGQVQMNRMVSGSCNAVADKIAAHTRTSSKQNCIKLNSSDASTSWTTYCPPMSSATLSDNGTTKTAIGSGTEDSPYIVVTGTTIKVSAEAESAIDDDNMAAKYNFKVGGSSQQNSTTTTYTHEASTNNTVYAMSVSAYNNYNSTDGTAANSNVIYYKALDSYTISYSAGGEDGVTGSHDSDTKYYGIDLTLPGVVFSKTGYTQTGWATSKGGGKAYNLSITNYSGNADATLYPVWTANPISVTLAKGTNGAANQAATIKYDDTEYTTFTAVSGNTGYRCTGYYDGETQVLNADGSFAADNVTGYITSGKWTKASDCTLTAHWAVQSYSITYKDGGNTEFSGTHADGHPTSHTYGSATALKKATKDNYAFAGWYTSSSCTGDAVTSLGATDYDDDIILYARWVELDLHQPGTYEKPEANGGYGRPLKNKTVSGSAHDYEVYMVTLQDSKGALYAGSKDTIPDGYAMFTTGAATTEIKGDGWVSFSAKSFGGSAGSLNNDEFSGSTKRIKNSHYAYINDASYVRLRVKGYDEFAFCGSLYNPAADKYPDEIFTVKINGASQTLDNYTDQSIHVFRFELDEDKEYFIEVSGITTGSHGHKFRGFSLRLPDVTRYTVSATNTDGYGSVDVTSISNVRSGSTIYTSSNTLTVGGTTVTATENSSTAQYSYAFNNWTKGDGTALPGTVTGAITVRANFTQTPVNYTLAWNANGGDALSGTYTSGSTGYGTAITAPNDPTRDGYTFTVWNSASNGSGDDYTGSMPAANTTYYAQWTKLYASGTYQFDGNLTVGTSPNKTVTTSEVSYDAFRIDNLFFSGSKIQFEGTDGTPQGDGDNYMGWKMKTNNSTIKFFVEYDSDVEVSIGGIGSSSSCKISYTDQSSVDHSNTSISAGTNPSYEVKAGTMVTITFTVDEGNKKSVTLKRIAISETAACTNPSASLSDGAYEVLGTALDLRTLWSSSNTTDGVTFTVTNAGGTSGTIAGDGYSFSASAAGSATIRAVQTSTGAYCDADETATITVTMPTYTVTLNTNGGTVKADNVTSYTYGTGATLPTDVTKSGYVFAGWYGNSGLTGDAVTTIADDAIGNKAYWAKWTALEEICETLNTTWLDAYADAKGEGTYGIINGVKYDVETKSDDASGITMGWFDPGDGERDTYFQLNIGDLGVIKEVKLTITDIPAKGVGNYGIVGNFFEDDGFTYYDLERNWGDGDNWIETESVSTGDLSLRPVSGNNNSFAFQTNSATLVITGICIYYEEPCFMMKANTSAASNGSLSHNESVSVGSDNCISLIGGTAKYVNSTGSGTMAVTSNLGWYFNSNNDQIVVTLTEGSFLQSGSVITVAGNAGGNNRGFKVNGVTVFTATGSGNFSGETYTVTGSDTELLNARELTITRSTGNGLRLSSISISNCGSCTPISPSLSYSKTSFWMEDATLTATPTLTGNTGSGAVTYSSSNTDAVTVVESGVGAGTITAVGRGTATITASIAKNGGYCDAEVTCDITVKDINCGENVIIEAVRTSGASTEASHDGILYGSSAINTATNGKLSGENKYFGLTLKSGYYFQNGDKLYVKLNAKNGQGDEIVVTSGLDGSGTVIGTLANASQSTDYSNEITLSNVPASTSSIVIYRTLTVTQNPQIDAMKVKRYTCPDSKEFLPTGDDGNWNATANWIGEAGRGASLPTIDDRVIISKPVTVDIADAKAQGVLINRYSGATGKVTVSAGKALIIADKLQKTTTGSDRIATAAEDVIINSDRTTNGVGALVIGGETGTNKATVNFETKAKNDGGWVNQFIGSPFSDNEPYVDYAIQLYKFEPHANGDRGWWWTHSSGTMTPFWGYNVLYNDVSELDVTWTGTLNASTSKTISGLYYNGSSETDNMFANSWTAPIHVGAIEDADLVNASKTLYMFNAGTPAQEEGHDGSNAANNNSDPGTYISIPIHSAPYAGIGVIPSMQAFYVEAQAAEASITLDYNKVVYTPALTSVGIVPNRAPKRGAEVEEPEVIKLHVQSETGWGANTYVLSREDFAEGYEDGWDGAYIEGESQTPKLYTPSIDGNMFINCLPQIEGTVVSFRKGSDDSAYTFSFKYDGEEEYYLNDLKEQTSTLINNENTYMFSAEAEDATARFIISATPVQKVTTGVDPASGGQDAKVRKVIINDHIYIIRGGRMYSVDGALVR